MKKGVRSNAGFTFVETVVSISVLLVFFAAVALITQNVFDLIGQSRVRTVAQSLGQEHIEYVRNLSFDNVGTIGGIPAGSLLQHEEVTINGAPFTIDTSVVYIDDPFDGLAPNDRINTDYKRVRIQISWQGVFPSRKPLVFVTDVAPRGLETTEKGGTLSILIFDANGLPISNASVHIVNSAVEPTIDMTVATDAQGRTFLPGAPACIECYEITVSKNGYSTERTYGRSEITNPAKPHVTIIEGDVSEISFNIDLVSNLAIQVTRSRESNYQPFTGAQFIMRGSKIIGTDSNDMPIYKYEKTHTSGTGGMVQLSGMEWDVYEIQFPINSSVDFAGSNPLNPFPLLPNSSLQVTVVTTSASNNSLLAVVTDPNNVPLASASVTLLLGQNPIATQSTGLINKGDFGQTIFSNLLNAHYDIAVTLPTYQVATASVMVSGDMQEKLIMSSE